LVKKRPKKTDCTVLREGIDYYIIESSSKKGKEGGRVLKGKCRKYKGE
jgi:hypothetical protein